MMRPWAAGRPPDRPSSDPTTRVLADLARAGHRVLDEPSMQVDFEIHHGVSRPGDLAAVLAGLPATETFADTLCSVAHGAAVVVGTRVGDARVPPGSERPPLEIEADVEGAVFRGSERPSLMFRHESAETVSGIVAIETEPRKTLLRHGLAILDTLRHVAETAVGTGDSVLLTLNSPAQLPPTNALHDVLGGPPPQPSRSSSAAIRFEMALDLPSADLRFQVADRLARYCAERGLGLWLGDTRPGYRSGNWFSVVPHDHSQARRSFPRAADRGAHTAAEGFVPVTLVGPARSGASHAVLAHLAGYAEVGVLGCAMSPLNELAFLHLQLAINGASRPRLAAVNRALPEIATSGGGPAEVLRTLVPLLLGGEPVVTPGIESTERLVGRAGDFRTAVGPALRLVDAHAVRRVPAWVSWRVRGGTGPRVPLVALQRAVDRMDLGDPDVGGDAGAAGIEYAVTRRGGPVTAGKAKIAVSKNLVDRRFAGPPSSTARLCAQLQDAWLDELVAAGHEARPGEIAVSPHESWLS